MLSDSKSTSQFVQQMLDLVTGVMILVDIFFLLHLSCTQGWDNHCLCKCIKKSTIMYTVRYMYVHISRCIMPTHMPVCVSDFTL